MLIGSVLIMMNKKTFNIFLKISGKRNALGIPFVNDTHYITPKLRIDIF